MLGAWRLTWEYGARLNVEVFSVVAVARLCYAQYYSCNYCATQNRIDDSAILRSKGTEAGMQRRRWVGQARRPRIVSNQGDADGRGTEDLRFAIEAVGAVEGRWFWSRKRRLIARSDMGRGARSCSNEYAGCTGAVGAESRGNKSRGSS